MYKQGSSPWGALRYRYAAVAKRVYVSGLWELPSLFDGSLALRMISFRLSTVQQAVSRK